MKAGMAQPMSATRRILIVDDSLIVRQQVRTVLEDSGFEVIEADSGEAGLVVARDTRADMMIIDVNMPGMNGLEMLAEVRKLAEYGKTPAFILTTESSVALIKKGRQVGATAWVVKPFNPDTLLKGIRKVLGG